MMEQMSIGAKDSKTNKMTKEIDPIKEIFRYLFYAIARKRGSKTGIRTK